MIICEDIKRLELIAKKTREKIIETSLIVGRAHPASSLSLVEILVTAFGGGFFPIPNE